MSNLKLCGVKLCFLRNVETLYFFFLKKEKENKGNVWRVTRILYRGDTCQGLWGAIRLSICTSSSLTKNFKTYLTYKYHETILLELPLVLTYNRLIKTSEEACINKKVAWYSCDLMLQRQLLFVSYLTLSMDIQRQICSGPLVQSNGYFVNSLSYGRHSCLMPDFEAFYGLAEPSKLCKSHRSFNV